MGLIDGVQGLQAFLLAFTQLVADAVHVLDLGVDGDGVLGLQALCVAVRIPGLHGRIRHSRIGARGDAEDVVLHGQQSLLARDVIGIGEGFVLIPPPVHRGLWDAGHLAGRGESDSVGRRGLRHSGSSMCALSVVRCYVRGWR